ATATAKATAKTKTKKRATATATASATASATPNPDRDGIVIVLGADARDPADYTAEPFQDEAPPVGKKKTGVTTSEASPADGAAADGSGGEEPTVGPDA